MTDNHDLPERVEPDAVADFEHDPLGALGGVDMGSILDVAQSMQASASPSPLRRALGTLSLINAVAVASSPCQAAI